MQHSKLFFSNKIFIKYRGGMTDAIKQMILKKGLELDFCEFEDLMGSFRFCDVTITKKYTSMYKIDSKIILN